MLREAYQKSGEGKRRNVLGGGSGWREGTEGGREGVRSKAQQTDAGSSGDVPEVQTRFVELFYIYPRSGIAVLDRGERKKLVNYKIDKLKREREGDGARLSET